MQDRRSNGLTRRCGLPRLAIDADLRAHHQRLRETSLESLFANNEHRFSEFTREAAGLFLDLSKNHLDQPLLESFAALCDEVDLRGAIDGLFNGERINTTEHRAAWHTLLRAEPEDLAGEEARAILYDVQRVFANMERFAEQIRAHLCFGYSGKPITRVVNIGIGGSYLGPQMAVDALLSYNHTGVQVDFVASMDPADLHRILSVADAESTLFIIASKSFTTLETRKNAEWARRWLLESGVPEGSLGAHLAAVSTAVDAATAFGVLPERIFPMWDWVGGRYSLWSAIGLPVMISVGADNFHRMRAGARELDQHFLTAPWQENLPVLLALNGIWYNNYWGTQSHGMLMYDYGLRHFPEYLQQLEMESNGKSVCVDGVSVPHQTGPVVWGGEGIKGQHAYFELLHQGTHMVPVDFVVIEQSHAPDVDQQRWLVASALSQGQAMLQGRDYQYVLDRLLQSGMEPALAEQLAPHKVIPGNRPSTTLMLEKLTPEALGALTALYEHKVYVQSRIWEINAFDQWGVELGKELADDLHDVLAGDSPLHVLDGSTAGLVARLRQR